MKRGELLYKGKAKSVYRTDSPDAVIMEFRDDITAFDGGKKDVIEAKGAYNCCVSSFFFRMLEANGVKTHYLDKVNRKTLLVQALNMVPIEVIVRNRAAGSVVRNFPFAEGQAFDPPIIVIDLKDDARHDPMLNDDLIFALKLLSVRELDEIRSTVLRINKILKDYLATCGIVLVDFKVEFGRNKRGLVLGDELSMDSMRLWDATTNQSLDKDVFRFNKGNVVATYRAVAERITGEECQE